MHDLFTRAQEHTDADEIARVGGPKSWIEKKYGKTSLEKVKRKAICLGQSAVTKEGRRSFL